MEVETTSSSPIQFKHAALHSTGELILGVQQTPAQLPAEADRVNRASFVCSPFHKSKSFRGIEGIDESICKVSALHPTEF